MAKGWLEPDRPAVAHEGLSSESSHEISSSRSEAILPGAPMPFLDHLSELRVRMLIVLVFAVLAFGASFIAAPRVLGWLMQPLLAAMKAQPTSPGNQLVLTVGTNGVVSAQFLGLDSPDPVPLTTESLVLAEGARLAVRLEGGSPVPIQTGETRGGSLFFLSPLEPFMLILKTTAIVSLIFTIPMAAYQAWLFVAPGLLSRERRVLGWTLTSVVVLFPLGASFAYAVSRLMLTVLLGFSSTIPGLEPSLVAGKGIGFILTMMVVFGLVFEFPLVLVLLSRLGVVNGEFLIRWRKTAIVLLSLLAAFATPSPDPFSMLAMFIPLVLLYELSIFAIRRLDPPRMTSRMEAVGLGQKSY